MIFLNDQMSYTGFPSRLREFCSLGCLVLQPTINHTVESRGSHQSPYETAVMLTGPTMIERPRELDQGSIKLRTKTKLEQIMETNIGLKLSL